jgi:branched-subunit amino acid transport protein
MSINFSIFLVILGCAIVTFIPRVVPYILVRNFNMPAFVTKWLSFIPVCIFTALIVNSFIVKDGDAVNVDWTVLAAIIPTLLTALFKKNLSLTVIVGIISMAVVRFFV